MGSKSVDFLKDNIGWVSFIYNDDTVRTFPTTLNKDILEALEVGEIFTDKLYNIDKRYWISMPKNASLNITESKPKMDEVNNFVNEFL